jgi:hypothetical protein
MASTSPAPETVGHESLVSDVAGMGNFLIDPAGAALRVHRKWFWVAPLIVISAIAVGVNILTLPFLEHVLEIAPIPPGTDPEKFRKGIAMSLTIQRFSMYATPLLVLAMMSIQAVLIYAASSAMAVRAAFRSVLNLVAGCSLINALASIATVIILRAKGEISTTAELRPPLGLDIFLGEDSPKILLGVLGYFSIFEIWWIVMMVLTYSAAFRVSKGKAFAAVLPIVILSLFFRVGFAVFGR